MYRFDLDYYRTLRDEIEILALAEQHDPEFDEKDRARLELLVALREYESAGFSRRAAVVAYDKDPTPEASETYLDKLRAETAAADRVTDALKRLNTLEGKRKYEEREICGMRWEPSRNGLPHRFRARSSL